MVLADAPTMPTGCARWSRSRAVGRISRRSETGKAPICFSPWLYKQRNLIERFFNKLKYFRRIATRYDKLGSTFLAMAKLACIRLRLRHNESTA
jgi:transposase